MKKLGYITAFVCSAFIIQSCFLLDGIIISEERPERQEEERPERQEMEVKRLSVGDKVGEKTIVWENTRGGSWRFLAMGIPSEPMPWDLNSSKYISSSGLSTAMGRGKENSIFLKREFESGDSKLHTPYNCAVMYCIAKDGWLPSRDEAEKIGQFTGKNFWTSNCDASANAFYYSPLQKSLQSKFRNDRNSIVTIPVYYLDADGRSVQPY